MEPRARQPPCCDASECLFKRKPSRAAGEFLYQSGTFSRCSDRWTRSSCSLGTRSPTFCSSFSGGCNDKRISVQSPSRSIARRCQFTREKKREERLEGNIFPSRHLFLGTERITTEARKLRRRLAEVSGTNLHEGRRVVLVAAPRRGGLVRSSTRGTANALKCRRHVAHPPF